MSAASTSPPSSPIDDALRLMPAPVAVVGAAADGILGGLTAAWVTRVSMAPPLLMVSIGHERYTWELLAAAEEFTVSLLAEGQVAEARLFGLKSRRDEDKWSQVDHVLMGGGVPALAHCSARFLCSIKHRFATGDHDCFVGLIASAEIVAGAPPLPLRGSDFA